MKGWIRVDSIEDLVEILWNQVLFCHTDLYGPEMFNV